MYYNNYIIYVKVITRHEAYIGFIKTKPEGEVFINLI